jgi:hypothetical protein
MPRSTRHAAIHDHSVDLDSEDEDFYQTIPKESTTHPSPSSSPSQHPPSANAPAYSPPLYPARPHPQHRQQQACPSQQQQYQHP